MAVRPNLKAAVGLILLLLSGTVSAQNFSAGVNTENPNPRAVLHLVSPNGDQGLLIPQLTTAQRTSMGGGLNAQSNGLLVYDNEQGLFYFWLNTGWIALSVTDNQTLAVSGTNLTIQNGNSVDLAATGFLLSETDPTVPDAIKDGIDWTELTNIPAGFADGVDEVGSSAGDGTTILGDGNATPFSVGVIDISQVNGLATIAASGSFNDLADVPANLDVDNTDDLSTSAVPAPGDVSGSFALGLVVDQVGGEAAADVGAATFFVTNNPFIDPDFSDDLTLSDTPSGGDVSGDFGTGLVVDFVGGEAAADVAAATALVIANPNIDLDATNDFDGAYSSLTGVSVVNADVNAAAAIAGTKISPNFGTQNISTSGSVTAGSFAGDGGGLINITATNFTGNLAGDVTGPQGTTVIANDAVTSAKILDGTISNVDIADVAAAKVTGLGTAATLNVGTAPNNVVQLDATGLPGVDGSQLTNVAAVSFTGNLAGDVTGPQGTTVIANDAVTSAKILDGTISNADIADVAAAKVTGLGTAATLNVGTAPNNVVQLDATGLPGVDGSQLTNVAAVSFTGNLAGDVTGPQGTTTIANNAVTSAKILDGTISNVDIADVAAAKVTGLGTAATLNVGTAPNNVVQLDATGLPAVDGSQLTNVAVTTITTPFDGDVLTWDNTNSRWDAIAPTVTGDMFAGTYDPNGIGLDAFAFQNQYSLTTPLDGDVLTWDNTNSRWDAIAPTVTGDMFAGTYDPNGIGLDAFAFQNQYSLTTPLDGDVLTWDNTNSRWDAIAPTVTGDMFAGTYDPNGIGLDAFAFQNQYSLTTPLDGDVLTWDNTNSRWDAIAPTVTGDMFAGTYDPNGIGLDAFAFQNQYSLTTPLDGDVLTWDNTNSRWDAIAPTVTGDMFAGTYDPNGIGLDAFAFQNQYSLTTPLDGDVLTWDNTNSRWDAIAPTVTGDMFAGTYDPNGIGLDAFAFQNQYSLTTPLDGDVLTWDNTNSRWDAIAPTVTGDMFAGTYDPNGIGLDAFAFQNQYSLTTPLDGDVLTWDNTNSRWDAIAPTVTGDMFAGTYDPNGIGLDAFAFQNQYSLTTPLDGDVLTWDNTNSRWDAMASNGFTLPYTNSVADINALFDLDNIGTGPAARFANTTFNGTAVLVEGNVALQQGSNRKIAIQDNTVAAGNDLEVAAGGTTLAAIGGVLALKGGSSTLGTGGNIRLEPGTGVSNGGIDMRGITRFGQPGLAPGRIELEDNTGTNAVSIIAPSGVASYTLTLPTVTGAGALTNDGSGALTWNPAGAGNYIIDANENQKGGASAAPAITTGVQNVVLGNLSGSGLTVGNGNVVAGHSGGLSLVGGSDNLVVGRLADVSGDGSNNVVLGNNADAAGSSSVVIGASASASGNSSIAMGENTQANGVRSMAFGAGTVATNAQTAIIGDGATTNTTFDVGIGTAAPGGRLEVSTKIGETGQNGIIINHQADSGFGLLLTQGNSGNINDAMQVTNSGGAGVSTRAGWFRNIEATNAGPALAAQSAGTGPSMQVDKAVDGDALVVNHTSSLGNGIFVNMNPVGTNPAVQISNSGIGGSITADGNITTSGNLTGTDIAAANNISAGVNITATGALSGATLSVGGQAVVNGRFITTPQPQAVVSGLPVPTSRIIRLTAGATTINGIAAGQNGQEVILINTTGGSILVNDGSLLLNNAAPFTMNNNATLHLIYDSGLGAWLEIGRSARP